MSSIEAVQVADLATFDLFLGGAVGGLTGFLVAVALPYFMGVMGGQDEWPPPPIRMVGAVGVVLINMFIGGVVAVFIGEATLMKQAVAYGFAWPALLKGAGESLERFGEGRQRAGDQ